MNSTYGMEDTREKLSAEEKLRMNAQRRVAVLRQIQVTPRRIKLQAPATFAFTLLEEHVRMVPIVNTFIVFQPL